MAPGQHRALAVGTQMVCLQFLYQTLSKQIKTNLFFSHLSIRASIKPLCIWLVSPTQSLKFNKRKILHKVEHLPWTHASMTWKIDISSHLDFPNKARQIRLKNLFKPTNKVMANLEIWKHNFSVSQYIPFLLIVHLTFWFSL